jgi:molybdopterin-containing oxidoreductase family membrane subunit
VTAAVLDSTLVPLADADLARTLVRPVLEPPRWLGHAILAAAAGTFVLVLAITYTVTTGIGVWGNNIPVAWAFAITNFVWWIGIGHAGTFISAFLLLLEQSWRTSINRLAEAMTLFAVVQAGLFPLLHLGRPWFFYWLVPYPPTMRTWPQFRSSLPWDVAAVTTYFTVSLLFWYLGMVPDLALVRDHAPGVARRRIYGVLALGWRGSSAAWSRYRVAYGLLAGLATPLVVSVHSVVSTDFAIANLPGWHSLLFPPYFVAGALYSGFAMVLTLMLPVRRLYRLEGVITPKHLDVLGKMMLLTGWIVAYAYLTEIFIAWLGGDRYEMWTHLHARPFGPFAAAYWTVVVCNALVPQALWFRRVRVNAGLLFAITILAQIGMWTERFMLIVTAESQDFLPSSWGMYWPSIVDWSLLFGTIAFFLLLFLLFLRFLPFVPITELLAHRFEARQETKGGSSAAVDLR